MRSLARACLSAFQVQMKVQVIEPLAYLSLVVFPLTAAAIGLYLLGAGPGDPRAAYAIIGGGLVAFWSTTFINANSGINGERWSGTLELLLGCPTPLAVVLIGKMLSTMLLGLVGFVPVLLVTYAVGGRMPAVQPLPFAISLVVTVFCFFAAGMLLALLYTLGRWIFPLVDGLQLFVYVLCGFMFPVSQVPIWAQPLSAVLAPTWAVRGLYAAAGQQPGDHLATWWMIATGLSLFYLLLAWRLFHWVDWRARVSGQLSLA